MANKIALATQFNLNCFEVSECRLDIFDELACEFVRFRKVVQVGKGFCSILDRTPEGSL